MPTYEYFCDQCASPFDAVQKFSDDPLTDCPQGHPGVRRVFRPAGIIFKGSGWYIKDSKNGSDTSKASAKSSESPNKEAATSEKSSTETTSKTESKPDAAAPVKSDAA